MIGTSRTDIEHLRKEYPKGTRVKLIRMDDPYKKIPAGTVGTVNLVDDAGNIHTSWEGYGALSMIPGVDEWERIDKGEE